MFSVHWAGQRSRSGGLIGIDFAALELKDLRVQLFANDYYLRVMIFGQLPKVFSLNRIDKIAGLRPAGITVISGRVYQLATQSGSDTSSKGILQTPAFAQMLDAITIGENESVHLYRNGIAAYFCLPDPARVELFMEGAVSFFNKLRLC